MDYFGGMIMRTGRNRDGRDNAFTLVELLIVIGIIAVLISVLLPALNRARAAANAISCGSNARQIGMAAQQYVNDYGCYPPAGYRYYDVNATPKEVVATWDELLARYLGQRQSNKPNKILICPADRIPREDGAHNPIKDEFKRSYAAVRYMMGTAKTLGDGSVAWQTASVCDFGDDKGPYATTDATYMRQPIRNMLHIRPAKVRRPTMTLLYAETNCPLNIQVTTGRDAYTWIKDWNYQTINSGNLAAGPVYNHFSKARGIGKMNYVFADGHVELLEPKTTKVSPSTSAMNIWRR